MTFVELGLAPPILRAIDSAGYTIPTPIQSQSIPHVLAGSDVLGCAQTGTGKTAAFALPILHRLLHSESPSRRTPRSARALVLSPTRELAVQIFDSFKTYGRHTDLRHTVIYGGVGQRPQVQAMQRGVDVVVATPGRLLDLMNQGHVALGAVEILVLDEADRMLDMGFLPDVRRLIAKIPAKRQTVFFSATMPEAITHLASAILRDPVRIRVAPVKETTELIEQSVCFVVKQQKPHLLVRMLKEQQVSRALVFTRTKHGADRVTRQLNHAGIPAQAIHGNKSQSARQRSLASFRSQRPPVLVATDLAARGIDVDNISHVFNFDLPHEPETYVHRIGRTGRAGALGIAVSFCDHDERSQLKAIERLIRQPLAIDRSRQTEEVAPQSPAPHRPAKQNGQRPAKQSNPRNRPPRGEQRRHDRHAAGAGQRGAGQPATGSKSPASPAKASASALPTDQQRPRSTRRRRRRQAASHR